MHLAPMTTIAYSGSQLCVLLESRHKGTERKKLCAFVPLPLCAWLAVVHPSENRYSFLAV
jgi:hypothetical protein